jgi:hypothetical protein
MKLKGLALILLVVAVIIAAAMRWFYFQSRSGGPAAPSSMVAIQDGKTIDFSSGKPVVKDSPEEKAIIDRATKEMDEAARSVTFGPPPKPADEKKPAEPPPAAPGKG